MIFVDTHTHLNDEELYALLPKVIQDARNVGVKFFLTASYDKASNYRALEIANKEENCFAALGLHPENLDEINDKDWEEIKKLAHQTHPLAIGETGLDYHYTKDEENKIKQKDFFIRHIDLANELQLPLTIHSRDAAEDTYAILSTHPPRFGAILHCYSYSVEMMKKFLSLPNIYFGFGGTLTFKNSRIVKEVLLSCPLERVVTETDAPYLSPEPFRGKMNEPKNVVLIAQKVAELRNESLETVSNIIASNTEKIFHVKLL